MYVNSLFQGHLSRNRNSLTRSFRNLSTTEERRKSYWVKRNYINSIFNFFSLFSNKLSKNLQIFKLYTNTYYAVHFWRLVTSTWMDTSNRFQSLFIPHIRAIRAIRWRKLKRGPSSVIHLWRNHTLCSVLCAFTVVIHCLKKKKNSQQKKTVKKTNKIFQNKYVKARIIRVLMFPNHILTNSEQKHSTLLPPLTLGSKKFRLDWQLQLRILSTYIFANILQCSNLSLNKTYLLEF